ncbi:regulatory protein ToxS [Vibrio sonorensis]|uniref:regulatory protein ToxS n=1 Tax=Vibrio sonorensis TaxID=1004316 RepID=UPI0008DA8276|nr:regulatory protein ToxS [Vibrio sonorensis]
MKINKFPVILFLASLITSAWLYWGSDLKVEQILTSREWQASMSMVIVDNRKEGSLGPLRRAEITANVKYLRNGTYIRSSSVDLYAEDNTEKDTVIHLAEKGEWTLSDDYLLVSPIEFKDVSSEISKEFTPEQLKVITQIYKLEAQQSRRVDIVNNKTLLLTSLDHGSTVLFSN